MTKNSKVIGYLHSNIRTATGSASHFNSDFLSIAGGVHDSVFLCCPFSHGMSWVGSWTWLGRFLLFQTVKIENKAMDPRLSKYSDANSVYYHCSALKKLLNENAEN